MKNLFTSVLLGMVLAVVMSMFFIVSCGNDDDDDDEDVGPEGGGEDDDNEDDDNEDDDDSDDDDDDNEDFGFVVCSVSENTKAVETNLYILNEPMAAPTLLLNVPGHGAYMPVVSPDGQTVVFSANYEKETILPQDPPGGSLYRMPIAGGDYTRITDDDWMYIHELQPAVSPDGQTIAYSRADKHVGPLESLLRIWLINLDGSEKQALFDDQDPRNDGSPAFSPDGQKLAYTSDFNSSQYKDILVVDLDDTDNPLRLTDCEADNANANEDPFFDAKGEHVYFTRIYEDYDKYSLFRVPVTGGDAELMFEIEKVDMPNHAYSGTSAYQSFRPTQDYEAFVMSVKTNDAFQVGMSDSLTAPFAPDIVSDTSWDCYDPYWWKE